MDPHLFCSLATILLVHNITIFQVVHLSQGNQTARCKNARNWKTIYRFTAMGMCSNSIYKVGSTFALYKNLA